MSRKNSGGAVSLAKRLWREHVSVYKAKFTQAILFMLTAAASTAALPYLLKPVFDEVLIAGKTASLFTFCGLVLAAFVLKGIGAYGEQVTMTYVGQRIIADMQNRLMKHLLHADMRYFNRCASGELLSRFTNDVAQMRNSLSNTLIGLGKDLMTLILLVGLMFYRDWILASVAFVVFPAAVLPIAKLGRRMRKVSGQTQDELARFTHYLAQVFQNIRVVKAYGAQGQEIADTTARLEEMFRLIYKAARVKAAAHPIVEALGGVAIISVIAWGGVQVMHQTRTAGDFVSFIGAFILAYEPLKRLSNINSNLQEGISSAMRVYALLDTPVTITDPAKPKTLSKAKGRLVFEQVSFAYDDKEVLHDLNVTVEPGQTVAFVGASGAGKSTLINLLPRFYDVTKGRILLDGTDIREYALKDLRAQMALVSQEVALFDRTISQNIAYGCGDVSLDRIKKAAADAQAAEFIDKLKDGYETMAGENGVRLSGGQRQRIAIARALLKDAPVLLLDEATSALDTEREKLVQEALRTLAAGRTTVTVAHRLSTVADADCIYVLSHGVVAEQGTHAQLLAHDGIYAGLWRKQT